jgi:predicted metallopeptidase
VPARFTAAPDVFRIAQKLIADYHAHLDDDRIRIDYLFTDTAVKKAGQIALGTARVVSNLAAFLAGEEGAEERGSPFFVITILDYAWKDLSPDQKIALVDHELMHCMAAPKMVELENGTEVETLVLSIRGHDLEEFKDIVHRHGFWAPDLESFARVVLVANQQMSLPFASDRSYSSRDYRSQDSVETTISISGKPPMRLPDPDQVGELLARRDLLTRMEEQLQEAR